MKYNTAIVSMLKNESMILDEWIIHHIKLGIEHMYIINNDSTDSSEQVLRKYGSYITYVNDNSQIFTETEKEVVQWDPKTNTVCKCVKNVTFQQYLVNTHYLEEIKKSCEWIMFIDCDEYMYSPKGYKITNILENIPEHVTQMFVPWKSFGSNGYDKQPPSIRKSFLMRRKDPVSAPNYTGYGKSIERVSAVKFLCPHTSQLFQHAGVLPNMEHMSLENIKKYNFSQNDALCCNHYIIMSKQYFDTYKANRTGGSTNIIRKSIDYWQRNDTMKDDVVDVMLSSLCDRAY